MNHHALIYFIKYKNPVIIILQYYTYIRTMKNDFHISIHYYSWDISEFFKSNRFLSISLLSTDLLS